MSKQIGLTYINSCLSTGNRNYTTPPATILFLRNRENYCISSTRLLLTKSPVRSFSCSLAGTRYLVWTSPAALADDWPGIRPFQLCWHLFEPRIDHNVPSNLAWSWSDGELSSCLTSASPLTVRLRWPDIVATMRLLRASSRTAAELRNGRLESLPQTIRLLPATVLTYSFRLVHIHTYARLLGVPTSTTHLT